MSKFLSFQILLTATPALICMSLLHSPASSAAEVAATETQEVIASTADLPLVNAESQSAIAQIKTPTNPAVTPEKAADIQQENPEKQANISLAKDSEKTAEISQSNEVNQTNIATEKSDASLVAIAPIKTQTNPAPAPEPTADNSPKATTNKEVEVAAVSQPNNLKATDTPTQKSRESNLLSESIQTPQNPAPASIADIPADSLEVTDTSVAPEMEQVTSVSQLSDVKPTDWAFQALQSLVERGSALKERIRLSYD